MKLSTIQKIFKENNITVFTGLDLERFLELSKTAAQKILERYTKKGIFVRLRKGYYVLETNIPHTFYIANYIYQPSYISLESALSYYQMIPESIYSVTSVTPRATQSFKVLNKEFSYTKIKSRAFTGYHKQQINGQKVLIAEPEKAVADYVYLTLLGKKEIPERFDSSGVSHKKLGNYIKLFERESMEELIEKL